MAAQPVRAVRLTLRSGICRKRFRRKDLPVPPGPVRKMDVPLATASYAARWAGLRSSRGLGLGGGGGGLGSGLDSGLGSGIGLGAKKLLTSIGGLDIRAAFAVNFTKSHESQFVV